MMNKRNYLLPLIFLILGVHFSLNGEEYFVIDHYQINMTVGENNSYQVTEIIDADYSTPRHGLIRDIPLYFDDMPVEISHISVPGYDMSIDRGKEAISIRIGSADTYVEGKVSYTISYTYDVGADNLPDMDEFNHNVIGNQWDTTIAAADFSIILPKAFDPARVNCTSGEYGSTRNTNVDWQVQGNTITGRLLSPLGNYEGLTVALPLPEGYWVGAVKHHEPGWLLYTVLGYPLYLLVVILAFILWYTKGRDNKLFHSIEFNPPEDLTPSEIGYIIDGQVDAKDVTSLIIYWAEKGYLIIEEDKSEKGKTKTLNLIKLKDPGSEAKGFERHIFKKLFALGTEDRVSTSDLTNKFYTTIAWGQKSITESFTTNPERTVFSKGSGGYTFLASLLAALPIIIMLIRVFSSIEAEGPLMLLAIPFSFFVVAPFLMLGKMVTGQGPSDRGTLIFSILFGGFSAFFFGFAAVLFEGIPLIKYISALASCFTVSIFVAIMSRRTEYGDKILEKILGFREFIKTAERDKLETLFESNPQYFYHILPYAMVLGLSSKWSSHFDKLAVTPPTWYRGYRYDTFRTRDFERNLNHSFSSLNSSMNSSPTSSGSSGSSSSGGSSGGGSGGGGGSSW